MKLSAVKLVQVAVAVLFLAAAVAPACAGQENCGMPCCRHKVRPVSSHADAAPARTCCRQPTDPSAGIGSGCRYENSPLAVNMMHAAPALPLTAAAAVFAHDEFEPIPSHQTVLLAASIPPKIPIFLRTQSLLI